MTTPEGPAATRCPDCDREKWQPGLSLLDAQATCDARGSGKIACYRILTERLRARLVEVERERDAAKASAELWARREGALAERGIQTDAAQLSEFQAMTTRALAAEARLSEVEGALREARLALAGATWVDRNGLSARIDRALSGSPPISDDESTRAFANLVELLLDQAKDVIGARAMETGSQRLHDMAREAAKLCAVARNMQSLPARHGAQGDPATQSNRSGWTAETPCRQSSPPHLGSGGGEMSQNVWDHGKSFALGVLVGLVTAGIVLWR